MDWDTPEDHYQRWWRELVGQPREPHLAREPAVKAVMRRGRWVLPGITPENDEFERSLARGTKVP